MIRLMLKFLLCILIASNSNPYASAGEEVLSREIVTRKPRVCTLSHVLDKDARSHASKLWTEHSQASIDIVL